MSGRALRLVGAFLAIFPWLPSRALRDLGTETMAQKTHPAQICSQFNQTDQRTSRIDSCSGLWQVSDPALFQDEREQDQEESPNTTELPPQRGPGAFPPAAATVLARSLERTGSPSQPVRLRC